MEDDDEFSGLTMKTAKKLSGAGGSSAPVKRIAPLPPPPGAGKATASGQLLVPTPPIAPAPSSSLISHSNTTTATAPKNLSAADYAMQLDAILGKSAQTAPEITSKSQLSGHPANINSMLNTVIPAEAPSTPEVKPNTDSKISDADFDTFLSTFDTDKK